MQIITKRRSVYMCRLKLWISTIRLCVNNWCFVGGWHWWTTNVSVNTSGVINLSVCDVCSYSYPNFEVNAFNHALLSSEYGHFQQIVFVFGLVCSLSKSKSDTLLTTLKWFVYLSAFSVLRTATEDDWMSILCQP